MSDVKQDSVLDILIVLNSLLQLIAQANQMATELMAAFNKARAEGRDLTDAELDEFRAKAVAARAKLAV